MRLHLVLMLVLVAILFGIAPGEAQADYSIYVGYADGLRGAPQFPDPWSGSPNVTFLGASGSGAYDAGAIMIQNTGASSITVKSIVVDNFENGAIFDLWGASSVLAIKLPVTLNAGQSLIVTQTQDYNFDTSDQPGHAPPGSSIQPNIHIDFGSGSQTFIDQFQILNTKGFDPALANLNEATGWRLIDQNFDDQNNHVVPEPTALLLAGIGIPALVGYGWRRRRQACA